MIKKLLWIGMLGIILVAVGLSTEMSKTMPEVSYELITGNEVLSIGEYYPYNPGAITESPGDIVGYTFYDYQTNGSSGNRVVVMDNGNIYFAWMKLLGWPYPPAPRYVYQNYVDSEGYWFSEEEGTQVSENDGSGYTNLDQLDSDHAVITYHVFTDDAHVYAAVEADPPGIGDYNQYDAPVDIFPQTQESPGKMYWPYIAVDRSSRMHIVFSENTDQRLQRLGYTRSEDGGQTWEEIIEVDTVMVISSVVDASPVSDRVAFGYSKCNDTTTQWNNDIVYYVSEDGTSWNWRYGRNNITNYGSDDDSLWAYTDLDLIFDYDDYLHVVWNAQWVTDEGIYFRTFLYHYSEATDEINEVFAFPDSTWGDISGAWNRTICKMNLGVYEIADRNDGIFMTWTQFDTSDVSSGGFGNGDIYMSYTVNNGADWALPVNLTNSHTPNCFPGECDSDHWSTLADVVNNDLHIFYTNDKDAGGIPQTEGEATNNPMKYLKYRNPLITSIDDNRQNIPKSFALNQNYPNPFNAKTTIAFDLNCESDVMLEVFDITGAKVTTLVNRHLPAGTHNVIWDASDVASGVYYYKLTSDNITESKKAILIK